jgi:hypothetical protein
MKSTDNYEIVCRENGTVIVRNLTYDEATAMVIAFESEDIQNDEFDENFYQVRYDFDKFLKNIK